MTLNRKNRSTKDKSNPEEFVEIPLHFLEDLEDDFKNLLKGKIHLKSIDSNHTSELIKEIKSYVDSIEKQCIPFRNNKKILTNDSFKNENLECWDKNFSDYEPLITTLKNSIKRLKMGDGVEKIIVNEIHPLSKSQKLFNALLSQTQDLFSLSKKVKYEFVDSGNVTPLGTEPLSVAQELFDTATFLQENFEVFSKSLHVFRNGLSRYLHGSFDQGLAPSTCLGIDRGSRMISKSFYNHGRELTQMINQIDYFIKNGQSITFMSYLKNNPWRDTQNQLEKFFNKNSKVFDDIQETVNLLVKGIFSHPIKSIELGDYGSTQESYSDLHDHLSIFFSQIENTLDQTIAGLNYKSAANFFQKGIWQELSRVVTEIATLLPNQAQGFNEGILFLTSGNFDRAPNFKTYGAVSEIFTSFNRTRIFLQNFCHAINKTLVNATEHANFKLPSQFPQTLGTWKTLQKNIKYSINNLGCFVFQFSQRIYNVSIGEISSMPDIEAKGDLIEMVSRFHSIENSLRILMKDFLYFPERIFIARNHCINFDHTLFQGIWVNLFQEMNDLSKNITNQLLEFTILFQSIARGEPINKIPVRTSGDMAKTINSINSMVDQIAIFSSEIRSLSAEIGEINPKKNNKIYQLSGAWKEVVTNVSKITSNHKIHVSNIEEIATEVTISSKNLKTVSNQITIDARVTSNEANFVSSAVKEINVNVQLVASGIGKVRAGMIKIGKSASRAERVGSQAVATAVKTNENIERLSRSSFAIDKDIKFINDIAEQTNLLALNATIEAAQAGKAGKGFAVVATEVKDLAKKTANATEDISRKIEAIQEHTDGAVVSIGEISSIIKHINEIQNSIESSVDEQNCTTSEIAENIRNAANSSDKITENIEKVVIAAKGAQEDVLSSQKGSSSLSELAIELKNVIVKFNVEKNADSLPDLNQGTAS